MAGWGVTVYIPDAEAGEGSSSSTRRGGLIVTPQPAKKAKKSAVEVFAIAVTCVYHNAEPLGRWLTSVGSCDCRSCWGRSCAGASRKPRPLPGGAWLARSHRASPREVIAGRDCEQVHVLPCLC